MMNKTSFWSFLESNEVEIPIIQRDYAQGRAGRETLRRNFLVDLKRAMDDNLVDEHCCLKLDFVYGAVESGKLQPLDGQQRLTTLWLLHWYTALRASKLREASSCLAKFSYETRISSREFCRELCKPENFERFVSQEQSEGSQSTKRSIVDFITNQTWFVASWKQDPTIGAMLRMLGGSKLSDEPKLDIIDGLEALFADSSDEQMGAYWERLVSTEPPFVFYYLPLLDFRLTDDLYVKMNARGKQLTDFENFKADLIGYIRARSEEEADQESWRQLLDAHKGIPIQLDTTWLDLFWRHRSSDYRVDEIYLEFINRFFWNELFTARRNGVEATTELDKRDYLLPLGRGEGESGAKVRSVEQTNASYSYLNSEKSNNYADLTPYRFAEGEIPCDLFVRLRRVLNNYAQYKDDFPTIKWLDFEFIPKYSEQAKDGKKSVVKTINQRDRIVFYAYCKYFDEGVGDKVSLARWLRVVRNMILGEGEDRAPQIRSAEAVRNAIELLNSVDSHRVYQSLCSQSIKTEGTTDIERRWNEEINKARQIMEGEELRRYDGRHIKRDGSAYSTWEDIIVEAENWAFFKGAIRFLFRNQDGAPDWSHFDTKWGNVQRYFRKDYQEPLQSALNPEYDNANLLKALISRFTTDNFWKVLWWSHSTFNNNPRAWLYYLLNYGLSRPVHEILTLEDPRPTPLQDSEENAEHILYQLTQTKLLDYVVRQKKADNYWLREHSKHRALFPSATGIYLDMPWRDRFLLDTPDIELIGDDVVVGDREFLFGWDIDFVYRGSHYRWYRTDYIYLMGDDGTRYMEKDSTKKVQEEKYYCFEYKHGLVITDGLEKLTQEYREKQIRNAEELPVSEES